MKKVKEWVKRNWLGAIVGIGLGLLLCGVTLPSM